MTQLTIVIPTLNRLELLKRALESVLAQTVEIEIIISDNGSSDGTAAYLDSLELPSQVRRFRHDTTMPVQEHAAFQFDQVRTPWAVFLSDDDFLEPQFAKRILALIEQQPDVKLVYTGCRMIYGDIAAPAKVGPALEEATDFFLGFMEGGRNICLCATAFRMGDLRAVGRQPPSVVIGDTYYWSRILTPGSLVGCIDEQLSNYTFYRPRRSSETNRTSVDAWASESVELADRMCAAIQARDPSRVARARRARADFLALTVSNQMTWNLLAGGARGGVLRSLLAFAPLFARNFRAAVQACAAAVMPRPALERLMLLYARRLAFRRAKAAT